MRAASIGPPETPMMLAATEDSLIPLSSKTFSIRCNASAASSSAVISSGV